MKAEHWKYGTIFGIDEDGNHPNKDLLTSDCEEFCCIIEGTDWDDIMKKYYEHMGWEPYKPME